MAEEVVAFSTTRKGGVSKGNHGELNLNEFSGDNAQDVLTNRRLMAERLGIAATHLIIPHQVHGTDVRLISNDFFALSDQEKTAFLDKVDGVMTNQKDVCIGVSTAIVSLFCSMTPSSMPLRPYMRDGVARWRR